MRLCIAAILLVAGVHVAKAGNIYCLPTASEDWNGIHWEISDYDGNLKEVTVSASMFQDDSTTITCKRGTAVAYAFVKGKCRFALGTVVTYREQLKGEAAVCHLDSALNDKKCVVECDK